eukprot:3296892-Alexandrium_andersonii.AAC.1
MLLQTAFLSLLAGVWSARGRNGKGPCWPELRSLRFAACSQPVLCALGGLPGRRRVMFCCFGQVRRQVQGPPTLVCFRWPVAIAQVATAR